MAGRGRGAPARAGSPGNARAACEQRGAAGPELPCLVPPWRSRRWRAPPRPSASPPTAMSRGWGWTRAAPPSRRGPGWWGRRMRGRWARGRAGPCGESLAASASRACAPPCRCCRAGRDGSGPGWTCPARAPHKDGDGLPGVGRSNWRVTGSGTHQKSADLMHVGIGASLSVRRPDKTLIESQIGLVWNDPSDHLWFQARCPGQGRLPWSRLGIPSSLAVAHGLQSISEHWCPAFLSHLCTWGCDREKESELTDWVLFSVVFNVCVR